MGDHDRHPNNQIRAYKSTDGGATWTLDGTPSGTQTTTDKELMWVDHSASSPHKDTIYVIWQKPTFVARRTSAGWQSPVQVSGSETTGSTPGADIKTNAAGDVFAFWPDTGSGGLFVAKSTDGGATFGTPVKIATTFGRFQVSVPADANRKALIYLSGAAYKADTTDAVYDVWADLSRDTGCKSGSGPGTDATSACKTRVFFSRSTDGGATWSTPTKINDQAGKNDQFFPRLALDETTGDLMASTTTPSTTPTASRPTSGCRTRPTEGRPGRARRESPRNRPTRRRLEPTATSMATTSA